MKLKSVRNSKILATNIWCIIFETSGDYSLLGFNTQLISGQVLQILNFLFSKVKN